MYSFTNKVYPLFIYTILIIGSYGEFIKVFNEWRLFTAINVIVNVFILFVVLLDRSKLLFVVVKIWGWIIVIANSVSLFSLLVLNYIGRSGDNVNQSIFTKTFGLLVGILVLSYLKKSIRKVDALIEMSL